MLLPAAITTADVLVAARIAGKFRIACTIHESPRIGPIVVKKVAAVLAAISNRPSTNVNIAIPVAFRRHRLHLGRSKQRGRKDSDDQ